MTYFLFKLVGVNYGAGYVVRYPWEPTTPADTMEPDAAKDYLRACLRHRIVTANIKRSNFRVRADGSLVFVDVGNWIIPLDISYFRDAAARLYSIGVLGRSDEELLRRPTDPTRPVFWDDLPGFSDFYGEVVQGHLRRVFDLGAGHLEPPPAARRRDDVTLMIKACAMDAAMARAQVIHIVDQLSATTRFHERVLAVDPYKGPFTRQHAAGDLDALLATARELQGLGVVDRVIVFPAEPQTTQAINRRWFGLDCEADRTAEGVPVAPQLWAFDQVRTRYLLQCDLDVLIGRRRPDHDVVGEMLDACRAESVLCVGFNIPHDPNSAPEPYAGEPGQFVPEVRCGLLDLRRIYGCLPLPNAIKDGRPTATWYRALQQHQRDHGLRTLRGGSLDTFYLHPPNSRKTDIEALGAIRDLVAQGQVPPSQWDRWDLEAPDEEWTYPERREEIVVLTRGRNTDPARLERFTASLAAQDDQDFGVVVIDDASTTPSPRRLHDLLGFLEDRLTLIRPPIQHGPMVNHLVAVRDICRNPAALIVVLDLDDAFCATNVISRLRELQARGHDVILGAPFRPDAPTKVYAPDFQRPRETWGGDVWIHLRAFAKTLFDQVPEDYFKVDGRWVDRCTDYATMIPMVELARAPIYLPEYLCWHERHTVLDPEGARYRDALIAALVGKPSLRRGGRMKCTGNPGSLTPLEPRNQRLREPLHE